MVNEWYTKPYYHLLEKSALNLICLLLLPYYFWLVDHNDWSRWFVIYLVVVSDLFAVPILVLWVELEKM